jgi:hypothetical protein
MTPFYTLIYILAYSESYTVAQKLSHRYVYVCVCVCVCVCVYINQLFSITVVKKNLQNNEWWPFQTANYGYAYAEPI